MSFILLLAAIINAECSNCSYEEQRLVGSVVLNRLYHPNYPKTLDGVVYQGLGTKKLQFHGICNTQFKPTSKTLTVAADLIFNGPDKRVMYFWLKKSKPQKWRKNIKILLTKKHHVFGE